MASIPELSATEWRRIGYQLVYRVKILPHLDLVEHLGFVWLRKDNRWNWLRKVSQFRPGWTRGQGVAKSEEEAKEQVVAGWEQSCDTQRR